MSLGYPHFPLRRGDVYIIKLPYVEDPARQELHPALVLRDERDESPRVPFTIVAYGTSSETFRTNPLVLPIDPTKFPSLSLERVTYFVAYRLHSIHKEKYFAGARYVGRLPKDLMDRFDELLTLALQLTEYKPFP